MLSFNDYRNMLQDVKHNDGLKELLFFICASPSKTYKHKPGKALQLADSPKNITKRLMRTVLILITIILLLSQFSNAQEQVAFQIPKSSLFYIQHSPETKTIIYELNYNSNGTLYPNDPIKGFWFKNNESQKLKPLSAREKKHEYGIQSKAIGNDEYEIRLQAYKKMPLYLKRSAVDNNYRLFIKDEDKNVLLKRVFIKLNRGTFWFPKLQYIDLITLE
ncbi:DUF4833 domain-containing protein [Pedobacter hiemivivus]|uniref:DUF4833 domain-containing protein n=1 Tax=Pedobacter hiemivivus TaxID=2530454 RepID=A0A4V5PC88_9SPHI|nr:DUF4833 domain-containing protein [Pedobacter hiemivivus]TKC59296.1 DUF4833 domain-containing protein [Pedobacter hiemivivus]